MNKLLPFALALALALPGCAAGDTAPQPPETPTTPPPRPPQRPRPRAPCPVLRAACAKRVMIPPPWGRRFTA